MEEEEKEHGASLYPDLRPLQPVDPGAARPTPSAPPAYPVASNRGPDPQTFRLTEISRIRHELNFELAVACISMGVALPISVPLGATSAVLGATAFITVKVKNSLVSRIVGNERVIILASSKINSISKLLSKIISDSDVTDEEYKLVVQEYERYLEMKKELRLRRLLLLNLAKIYLIRNFRRSFSLT